MAIKPKHDLKRIAGIVFQSRLNTNFIELIRSKLLCRSIHMYFGDPLTLLSCEVY